LGSWGRFANGEDLGEMYWRDAVEDVAMAASKGTPLPNL
jgi:hypothetical protein